LRGEQFESPQPVEEASRRLPQPTSASGAAPGTVAAAAPQLKRIAPTPSAACSTET
jgi:hypothetical protein